MRIFAILTIVAMLVWAPYVSAQTQLDATVGKPMQVPTIAEPQMFRWNGELGFPVTATVFSDSDLRAPGRIKLEGNNEISINFETKALNVSEYENFVADLCEGQRYFRTGFFDPTRNALLTISTRSLPIPDGCQIEESEADALFDTERERDGTIFKIHIGTGGYLLLSSDPDQVLSPESNVVWIGESDAFEFALLSLSIACGMNCDPTGFQNSEVFSTIHEYLDPRDYDHSDHYEIALKDQISSWSTRGDVDFLAMPSGYLRYKPDLTGWSLVEPYSDMDPVELFGKGQLSTAPPVFLYANDAIVLEAHYNSYLSYLFAAKMDPEPVSCYFEEFSCLANMFKKKPTEVLWNTAVQH